MSLTTLTIASRSYPSYASVDEADTWLAVDPTRAATWAALDDAAKSGFLVAATRRLDLLSWRGRRTNSGQTTAWPRKGMQTAEGLAIANTIIPAAVEAATALLAGTTAGEAGHADVGAAQSGERQVSEVRAGSVQVRFAGAARKKGAALSDPTVLAYIAPWLSGRSQSGPTFGGFGAGGRAYAHNEP